MSFQRTRNLALAAIGTSMVIAVAIAVAGCGGSTPASTSTAGESEGGREVSGSNTSAAGVSECPLSQAQVNDAFGFAVPHFQLTGADNLLCAFNRLGEAAKSDPETEEPQLLVDGYAANGGLSTPSQARNELEESDTGANVEEKAGETIEFIEKPEWGGDAGVNLTVDGPPTSPVETADAIILLPHVLMYLSMPGASAEQLRSTAMRLGDDVAG